MSYRVYDSKKKIWIKDSIYLNSDGELFKIKKSVFGMVKIPSALSSDRYIYHEDIGLTDKNGNDVFEGDYIKAVVGKVDENDENSEDKVEIGLVTYAHELSAYVILCVDSDVFYTLGSEITEFIEVIGNVFDGYEK
jgi:hypothetical protein